MKALFLIPILLIVLACVQEKQQVKDELASQLHENVIDLRVPGKWRDAGTFFVQTYPHARQEVLDTLFAHILPEEKIDLGQWGRNEPILWVLAMLDDTYGVKFNHYIVRGKQHGHQMPDSTILFFEGYSPGKKLIRLRESKEYAANKSFATHVEQLLKGE